MEHMISNNSAQYLVSVIIPVYNTEKYLAECIDSVLAQNISGINAVRSIEIILVNDGSPDSSQDIIKNMPLIGLILSLYNKKMQGNRWRETME